MFYWGGVKDSLISLTTATTDITTLLFVFWIWLGQIGVCIFIVCSAWFLVDSKKAKFKKILSMWIDVFIISVGYMLLMKYVYPEIPLKLCFTQLFPFTFGEKKGNWFISCYLLYYLIHPILNRVLSGFTKKQHFISCVFLTVIWGCAPLLIRDLYYYSSLMGFVLIHFIVDYVKRYGVNFSINRNLNIKLAVVSTICIILCMLLINFIGLRISFIYDKMFSMILFSNPLIILLAVSLFNLFNSNIFYSKAVNYISGCTLLIYVIHENYLLRMYAKAQLFEWIYVNFGYDHIVAWCVLLTLISFLGALLVAWLYKHSLGIVVEKISDYVGKKLPGDSFTLKSSNAKA